MYLQFISFWGGFWEALVNSRELFFEASQLTLALTAVSIFIAIFVGLFFALLKISNIKPLEWIANAYIYIVRGTPLIVQIFVFYYGLTNVWMISGFWSVSLGLAFHNGAYIAEIFRGSIQSIGKGQTEAGRSLGMSQALTMRRIILPQAFRRALPPLGNQFIIGLKDSSLAAFIGVSEIFAVATTQGANTFDYMTWLLVSAVYYLILVFLLTLVVSLIEKKMAVSGDE
ncbi:MULTISPECIES: amino acid ABC transporter permease [Halobacillus]|uniref:ABC-type transport system permease protein (Probable substrate polar amino acid) n=1 Tax=Halobacillus halophilus (strain ATCC 35676 / DSM 2266 / JCM 20832 / KCTC 3685 / LMG 17431 / NBRC 102448 / NCIMB 2269) TaxID=866895 RepID=I0JPF9_HALH3|nr:amino acid ABC transporter permease [Halobacillus halophilus]ASF40063.1 amino acid ABC transporter permease [Halobacillus halophilus]CCG46029.1 ABC-type transport system permease protein (probable substrate polar amino acid) [Halobacillus halophilus DSM 2266]